MKTITPQTIIFCITITILLSSCCPTDYTSKIKSIMKPMKKNLSFFFEEEQTYPSETQRDSLLEKSGCKISDPISKTCIYNDNSFTYESNIELSRSLYFFSIAKKTSHCHITMTPQGEIQNIECVKDSCINIDP